MLGREKAQSLYKEYGDELLTVIEKLAASNDEYADIVSWDYIAYLNETHLEEILEELNAPKPTNEAEDADESQLSQNITSRIISSSLNRCFRKKERGTSAKKNLAQPIEYMIPTLYHKEYYLEKQEQAWQGCIEHLRGEERKLLNPIVAEYAEDPGWYVCRGIPDGQRIKKRQRVHHLIYTTRSVTYFHTDLLPLLSGDLPAEVIDTKDYSGFLENLLHPLFYLYYEEIL